MVVHVGDDDGDQTEQQDHSGGVDDRVQRLDAWREELHAAEVLQDTDALRSAPLVFIETAALKRRSETLPPTISRP